MSFLFCFDLSFCLAASIQAYYHSAALILLYKEVGDN